MQQEEVPEAVESDGGFAFLSCEILLRVFSLLSMEDLRACMRVSFHWASVARVERLWLGIIVRHWRDFVPSRSHVKSFLETARSMRRVDRAWETGSATQRTLCSSPSGVVDFLLRGEQIVHCGLSKFVSVYNRRSGETRHVGTHKHYVCRLREVTPAVIAATSYDGTISLLGASGGEGHIDVLDVWGGHTGAVLGTRALGTEGLLSYSKDGTVRLWDMEKGGCGFVFKGHEQSITGVKVIDLRSFVSCSRDGSIALWDARSQKPTLRAEIHTCDVYGIHLPKRLGNDCVASCSADQSVKMFDFRKNAVIQTFRTPQVVYSLKTNISIENACVLFGGGGGGSLIVADLRQPDGAEVAEFKTPTNYALNCVKIINGRVTSGDMEGTVTVFERELQQNDGNANWKMTKRYQCHKDLVRRVKADHLALTTCGYDGSITQLDFANSSGVISPSSGSGGGKGACQVQ
jgi:WD40 repeat protein